MTTKSPSHVRIRPQPVSHFVFWLGFLWTVFVVLGLYQLLWGENAPYFGDVLYFEGIQVAHALLIIPMFALVNHAIQGWISHRRPRNWIYGFLDFITSVSILLLPLGAIASWWPLSAPYVIDLGGDRANDGLESIVAIILFVPLALWDLWRNHLKPAIHGRPIYGHVSERNGVVTSETLEEARYRLRIVPEIELDLRPWGRDIVPIEPTQAMIERFVDHLTPSVVSGPRLAKPAVPDTTRADDPPPA